MAITFNADEILGMAEQIERNGARFYRKGAEIATTASTKKLMSDLAAWEEGHEKLFASMRAELTPQDKTATAFDPDGEAELYLQAVADTHVFTVNKDPTTLISNAAGAEEVLRTALDFEKDSILFFMAMGKMVPARLGKDRVDKIVQEEFKHVAFIRREMNALQRR